MVVLILECVPVKLRGELTRWFVEPKAGVFVGKVSAMVRDRLWDKACKQSGQGGCIMIHSNPTEQGYRIFTSGRLSRSVVDFEGISLIRHPN